VSVERRLVRHESVVYSIIVPCYCSGDWLQELVERIRDVMNKKDDTFEIILVNDASPDSSTWSNILQLSEQFSELRGLNLIANVGQYRATLAGFEHARGQYIITMDDDLQHPPEEIPLLIEAMKEHAELDCIIGSFKSKKHSLFRNAGSRLINSLLNRFYDKPKGVKATAFRILRMELAQAVLAHRSHKPNLMAVLLQSSKRVMNIEVEHHSRQHGRSGYTLSSLIGFTFDNIFAVTNAPLRIVSIAGIMTSFVSVILMFYFFTLWISGSIEVLGFTTQVLLITFFGGMTLFSIGLLGEYVLRIVVETSGPPRYFVRDDTNDSESIPSRNMSEQEE